MVAGAGLLEALEVCVEIDLREEGGSVDSRQLRLLLVASPVRAREPGEFQCSDRRRFLQVRPAAEIGELALRVERDLPVGLPGELDLVGLTFSLEPGDCLLTRELLAGPRAAFGKLTPHLLLDRSEIVFGDRLGKLEVVVEAVGDRGTDRDLDPWMKPQHRLREQVRGRVPQDCERVHVLRIARGQESDLLPVRERQAKVSRRAVHADQHSLLGELWTDRARRVESRSAVRELELGGVREHDLHRAGGYESEVMRGVCPGTSWPYCTARWGQALA